jgi:hypothetical protein
MGALDDKRRMEIHRVPGSIDSGDPEVDRHCLILSCNVNSHCMLFNSSSCSLLVRFHTSSVPGCIISAQPLPMLHEPELLFITNTLWIC